jgi:hypothetical protein
MTTILIGHQQTGASDIAMKNEKHPSQKKKAGGGGGGGGGENINSASKTALLSSTSPTSLAKYDRPTLDKVESQLKARKDQIEMAMDRPSTLNNPSREERLFNQSVKLDLAINKVQIAKGTASLGIGTKIGVSRFERTNRPTVAGRR